MDESMCYIWAYIYMIIGIRYNVVSISKRIVNSVQVRLLSIREPPVVSMYLNENWLQTGRNFFQCPLFCDQ